MVSVVMITYNHGQFISQAIEGVLMQKCDFEIELIVSNDCSLDNTDEIVNQIIINHPNSSCIKYTKHKENKGMMDNLTWSLEQAQGNYIALCEGDDYWIDPLKLKKQVDFLNNNSEYNLIVSNALLNESEGLILEGKINSNFSFSFSSQILSNRCISCTSVFRAQQLNIQNLKLFADVKIGDLILWAFLLRNKKKGFFLNENTAVYRIHSGGVYSQRTLKENSINELNVYFKLIESGLFTMSEKSKIKTKIQLFWYDILTSRDWFTKTKSFLGVIKNLDMMSYKSIVIFFKGSIRFIIARYNTFD